MISSPIEIFSIFNNFIATHETLFIKKRKYCCKHFRDWEMRHFGKLH